MPGPSESAISCETGAASICPRSRAPARPTTCVVGGGLSGWPPRTTSSGTSAAPPVFWSSTTTTTSAATPNAMSSSSMAGRSCSTAAPSTSSRRFATTCRRASCFEAIGVDLTRFVKSNESLAGLYNSLGLRSSHFFDKETWGADRLVVRPAGDAGGRGRGRFPREYLRADADRAAGTPGHDPPPGSNQPDYMPGLTSAEKKEQLARMSLEHYLLNVAKAHKDCLWFFITTGRGNFCVGADAVAGAVRVGDGCSGLPGPEARADAGRGAGRSAVATMGGRRPRWRRQYPLPRRQCHRRPPPGALAHSRGRARHDRRTSAQRGSTTRSSIDRIRPPGSV